MTTTLTYWSRDRMNLNVHDLPIFHGALGAIYGPDATTFRLWAPTAKAVTLRLYATGSDAEPGSKFLGQHPLSALYDGAWELHLSGDLAGYYYDYALEFEEGVTVTADPWAVGCGINGDRSMVVDFSRCEPAGWRLDKSPEMTESPVVWELHVGDFTADPRGGVPKAHRGKYMGFTYHNTTLDSMGKFPTCLNYLKRLGVSHVQLMPIFDYGSRDERCADGFNWGYDPKNYNCPEGSYATDPYDGRVRIRECRAMVAALHKAGIRVVMDMVYNHMYTRDNWFERTVPGYYCRRNPDGSFSSGSGCGNDMASEREMFRKFMVASCVHWAQNYHIDGFRFDLMGLHDVGTMTAIRRALNTLPGGEDILMYGEPWAAGASAFDKHAVPALKSSPLPAGLGYFCDDTRDLIKGSVFSAKVPGFVNGNPGRGQLLEHAFSAWADGMWDFPVLTPDRVVQYVSCHDNLTLWDKLKMVAGDRDFAARSPELLAQNKMAAALYFLCRGLPFMQAGEEFARTKLGDDNSYNASQRENQLDWARAQEFSDLTKWYQGLMALRRAWPELRGSDTEVLRHVPLVVRRGRILAVYNPGSATKVQLPDGAWRWLCDGETIQERPFGKRIRGQVQVPKIGVVILCREPSAW